MSGGFLEAVVSAGEAGPTLTGTAEASIIPPAVRSVFTRAGPGFDAIGDFIAFDLRGILSTVGSSPGTLTFKIKFGSVVVWQASTPTLAVSLANKSWALDLALSLFGVGESAVAQGIARFSHNNGIIMLPDSAPVSGNAFDATTPQKIDVTAQFSVTGNSLTSRQYRPVLPMR